MYDVGVNKSMHVAMLIKTNVICVASYLLESENFCQCLWDHLKSLWCDVRKKKEIAFKLVYNCEHSNEIGRWADKAP